MRRKKTPEDAVEQALLRRACGYRYTETTVEEKLDKEGRPYTVTRTVDKDQPPHAASAMFYLANRCPGRWQYRPGAGEADGEEGPSGIILTPVMGEEEPE